VITALAGSGVPVPPTHGLCEDASVIGTSFFVMSYVPGRILRDASALEHRERKPVFEAMGEVLARLHAVDVDAVGLRDFGRPGSYFARQVSRWSRQYELSKTDPIPAMDELLAWLPEHTPDDETTTLVHGDYRLGNLIVHPEEPRIVAVLDWELSTLGSPLADLAYNCVFDVLGTGLENARERAGVPSEEEYVEAYRRRSGRDPWPHWNFCLAFSLFRLAAITQGVYARGLRGNASSTAAMDAGQRVAGLAERAWAMASRA
jgi:aminoglycoside phosphotransferase (APT) family kinase protein